MERIIFWRFILGGVCLTKPCHNGGSCVNIGETFECICRKGFTGKRCKGKRKEQKACRSSFESKAWTQPTDVAPQPSLLCRNPDVYPLGRKACLVTNLKPTICLHGKKASNVINWLIFCREWNLKTSTLTQF